MDTPITSTRQIREEYLKERLRDRGKKKHRRRPKFDVRHCGCLYIGKKRAIPCIAHTEED